MKDRQAHPQSLRWGSTGVTRLGCEGTEMVPRSGATHAGVVLLALERSGVWAAQPQARKGSRGWACDGETVPDTC